MITGSQPCNKFKPHQEGNEFAVWDNLHECPRCGKTRSFCVNCNQDHHEGGWDDCWALKKPEGEV